MKLTIRSEALRITDKKIIVVFQVVSLVEVDLLKSKLKDIIPGVIRGYCHSESSVRKASVFCLVSIHAAAGEDIRQHLTKLSSSQVSFTHTHTHAHTNSHANICTHSQTKLLDLYIKRNQQETAKKGSGK